MKIVLPNKEIFREYDIRGIWNKDINEDVAYSIGRALGTIYISKNINEISVGYDNRGSSPVIFNSFSKGIMECGVNIIFLGLITTPMYYYSWHLLNVKSGVMITASHNPKEYNGFKMSFNGMYNAFGDGVLQVYETLQKGIFASGNGVLKEFDIKSDYIKLITENIKLGPKKMKVVYDCGNGTSCIVADEIMKSFKFESTGLFTNSDPDFPNHHPDPSVEDNVSDLKKTVIEKRADVGIAYDGDGDRLGIVDENGVFVGIDKFMALIWKTISKDIHVRKGLFDVKCSKALEDVLISLDIEPYCRRTGNSYMMMEMKTNNFDFGGELSGHVYFNDKFIGIDDGIYAGLRLIEILSNTDKTLSELINELPKYYNTNELKRKVPDDKKRVVMERVLNYVKDKGYKYIDIDGIRVEFDDGFALIRPSNTGPNITIRYEGKTKTRLNQIIREFDTLLDNILL